MIYIIFAWAFWFLFCFNLGYFVLNLIFRKHDKLDVFYYFWFGIFLTIVISEFISFFFPLNPVVVLSLVILNYFLFILNVKNVDYRKKISFDFFKDSRKVRIWVIFFIIAVFVAYISSFKVSYYDTNLYHLNAVKWLTEYGTVKGLANVHIRLGINSVTFILAAIMDSGIFKNSSSHVMNSLLYIVFVFQMVRYIFEKKKNNLAYLFSIFAVIISVLLIGQSTFARHINSLSTDFSLAIIILVFDFYFIFFKKGSRILLLPIILLAATIKFSCLVMLGLFVIMLLVLYGKKLFFDSNLKIVILSSIYFIGFIIRNTILSGWVLFPFPGFGLPFVWKVPGVDVKYFSDQIASWSRINGEGGLTHLTINFGEWFPIWFRNNSGNLYLYLLFVLIILVLYYFLFSSNRKKSIDFLIFFHLITLVYIFTVGPDFRYMAVHILAICALILSCILVDFVRNRIFMRLFMIALIFLIPHFIIGSMFFSEEAKLLDIKKEGSLPVKKIKITYPDQEFEIWKPVEGDRCGNSQLPCSVLLIKFKEIKPGNIGAGFYPAK